MECEFCKKSLSNKSNLIYHQKTSKKCLNIQDEIEIKLSTCEFCNKCFSTKSLKIHLQPFILEWDTDFLTNNRT